jgi:hypothetical protein
MWKVRDKVVREVRALITSRRAESWWCNIGSPRVGNCLLVRALIFTKHKSSGICDPNPGVIAKSIVVLRLFLLCHDRDGEDDENRAPMTEFLV